MGGVKRVPAVQQKEVCRKQHAGGPGCCVPGESILFLGAFTQKHLGTIGFMQKKRKEQLLPQGFSV